MHPGVGGVEAAVNESFKWYKKNMRPGDGGVATAVIKMYVLPLFSRAEQLPFEIPVHVPGKASI